MIQPETSIPTEELFQSVYLELRSIAKRKLMRERSDHTLQATALVHEVFLRLFKSRRQTWSSTDDFLAAAAESMRRILVDSARAKRSLKRNGQRVLLDLDALQETRFVLSPATLIEIDDALNHLSTIDKQAADLLQLRIFAGLSVSEAGQVLGLSRSTAYDVWTFGKAWFAANSQSAPPP